MFILTHDGGLVSKASATSYQVERILVQRTFLFSAMSQGVAVVLLNQADFKDDKVRAVRGTNSLKLTAEINRSSHTSTIELDTSRRILYQLKSPRLLNRL